MSKSPAAWIIGEPTNVEAVSELARSLSEQLGTMADAEYAAFKNKRHIGDPYASAATFKTNFYNGATNAIHVRLDQQRKEFIRKQAEEAAVTNTNRALVVIDQHEAAIRDFVQETFNRPPKNVKLQSTTSAPQGYEEGWHAGERVELNKLLK